MNVDKQSVAHNYWIHPISVAILCTERDAVREYVFGGRRDYEDDRSNMFWQTKKLGRKGRDLQESMGKKLRRFEQIKAHSSRMAIS